MSTNFLQWNPTEANQETDAQYLADALRVGGAPVDAIYPSPLANKVFYQASTMAKAFADFMVAQGLSPSDASLASLKASIAQAISVSTFSPTVGGTANAITLTYPIAPLSYQAGQEIRFIASATNTGAATINVNGLGVVTILKKTPAGLVALVGDEIVSGLVISLVYDGTHMQLGTNAQSGGSVWAGTSGGSANAQTLTPSGPISSYAAGQRFTFVAGFTNTGAMTLNVSGVGAIAVKANTFTGPAALIGGEIVTGNEVTVTYTGSSFEIEGFKALPTTIQKVGSNGGDYATASGTYVNVDGTNLSETITIPVGWKLLISISGCWSEAGGGSTGAICVADGGTPLQQTRIGVTAGGAPCTTPFSLNYVINGDGASHTITLEFFTGGGSFSNLTIVNSGGFFPVMTFFLTPSN